MSKKRQIADAVKALLENLGLTVSRKLSRLQDLGQHQLPAVSITNGLETLRPEVLGSELYSTWDLHLVPYIHSNSDPQGDLDDLQARITKAMLTDPTLGGVVVDTELVSRDTDRGVFEPFAAGDMVFRIQFLFDRITEGG